MKSSGKFGGWWLILVAGFIVAACSRAFAQPVEGIPKAAFEAARQGLSSYVGNVINEDNFSRFGFKSLAEAQAATLGDPYREAMIGLKNLKGYQANTGMETLLTDTNSLWFPVLVDSVAKTKMEMVLRDGRWIAGEFGGTRSAMEIVRAGQVLPRLLQSEDIQSPYDVMLVKIPVLFAVFLYIKSSSGEFLVPAMIQPERFDLQPGNIYSADEILPRLAEEAKKIDENTVR